MHVALRKLALATLFFHVSSGAILCAAAPPHPIGTHKQLLIDDYAIAEVSRGVIRVQGRPTKIGVVLEASFDIDYLPPHSGELRGVKLLPGERIAMDFGVYRTPIYNNHLQRFQMWYMANRYSGLAYAESKDGVHWTKPLISTDGVSNLIFPSQGEFSCFIDPNVPWGHPEKYKGAGRLMRHDAAHLYHSADGLQWAAYNAGKPVTHRAGDFQNQLLWDPLRSKYRLLTRTDVGAGGGGGEIRSVRIMEHTADNDLTQHPTAWKTLIDRIMVDDPRQQTTSWSRDQPRLQINSMSCWLHEGVYFGLMDIYFMDRQSFFPGGDYVTRHAEDFMEFFIATSRDGLHFDKRWIHARKPFIPRGEDGSFDKDGTRPPSNIVTRADEHWIYYGGMAERHYSQKRQIKIGLAKLRLDRFIGLKARGGPGTVVTKPFRLEGPRLVLNVEASHGSLQVEVLDAGGKPFPRYSGDSAEVHREVDDLRLAPQWKDQADLSTFVGQIVCLRFRLENATLYSFQVMNCPLP